MLPGELFGGRFIIEILRAQAESGSPHYSGRGMDDLWRSGEVRNEGGLAGLEFRPYPDQVVGGAGEDGVPDLVLAAEYESESRQPRLSEIVPGNLNRTLDPADGPRNFFQDQGPRA